MALSFKFACDTSLMILGVEGIVLCAYGEWLLALSHESHFPTMCSLARFAMCVYEDVCVCVHVCIHVCVCVCV